MLPKHYFKVMCCPKCKSDLEINSRNEEELICSNCESIYPVIEDIPILLNEKDTTESAPRKEDRLSLKGCPQN